MEKEKLNKINVWVKYNLFYSFKGIELNEFQKKLIKQDIITKITSSILSVPKIENVKEFALYDFKKFIELRDFEEKRNIKKRIVKLKENLKNFKSERITITKKFLLEIINTIK